MLAQWTHLPSTGLQTSEGLLSHHKLLKSWPGLWCLYLGVGWGAGLDQEMNQGHVFPLTYSKCIKWR